MAYCTFHPLFTYKHCDKTVFRVFDQVRHAPVQAATEISKRFDSLDIELFEPHYEKTGLRGFRPGPTQTGV